MSFDSPTGNLVPRPRRLDLIISPGRSLGWIRLGMSIWDVTNHCREQQRLIPTVDFKYSDEDPLGLETHLTLPQNGLNLRFDGPSQRLKSVECFDLSRVRLSYLGVEICSSKVFPTILLVYKSFGPTYPGIFDKEKSTYNLTYPGLTIAFHIPAEHAHFCETSSDLPLEFPGSTAGSTTPVASHLYLFQGSQDWLTAVVPGLGKVVEGGEGGREVERVVAEPTKGITIHFAQPTPPTLAPTTNTTAPNVTSQTSNTSTSASLSTQPAMTRIILFTTTPQDLLVDLGKPSRIFYKEEDKMRIHSGFEGGEGIGGTAGINGASGGGETMSGAGEEGNPSPPTDYFYNYYHFGLDVLFDGTIHTCKKIVLHGNVPGHYDFGRYKRCPFEITFLKSESIHVDRPGSPPNRRSGHGHKKRGGGDSSSLSTTPVEPSSLSSSPTLSLSTSTAATQNVTITAAMKIAKIQELLPHLPATTEGALNNQQQRPVIFNRGSSGQNPFGSSVLTGLDEGVVFEICRNGCLAGVVLF